MEKSRKAMRILCFGDSLTEGWYQGGRRFHPYSLKLESLFERKTDENIEITSKGISGECVYPEMTTRLPTLLKQGKSFDLVIILGGTNDLASLSKAKSIDLFQQIKKLHITAHDFGAKTCAITIPQTAFDMLPGYEENANYREGVNKEIRDFAASNNKVCLCDVSVGLPMYGVDDDELQKHWDDELHFTPQGYDRMAELIFEAIKHFI